MSHFSSKRLAVLFLLGISSAACNGTVANVGDAPSSAADNDTDCAFAPGDDVCNLVAKDGSPGAAEFGQAVSEMSLLAKQSALELAWACDAIATMNPTNAIPAGAPTPAVEEVERKCTAAEARIDAIVARIEVTVEVFPGRCSKQLCPTQGLRACFEPFARADVVPAGTAEITLAEKSVLRAALAVAGKGVALAKQIGDVRASLSGSVSSSTELRAACIPPVSAASQSAVDLTARTAAVRARLLGRPYMRLVER
jgi:hypothetical protein